MTPRRGFTLIELMMVIAIIAILAGMAIPAYMVWQRSARLTATRGLVLTVATAIHSYGLTTLPITALRREQAWDANRDGLLDGSLHAEGAGTLPDWDAVVRPALAAQGYDGLPATLHLDLPARFVNGERQIIDAWKKRLHIAWALRIYGDAPFAVWSVGPDGQLGSADDIGSWPAGTSP